VRLLFGGLSDPPPTRKPFSVPRSVPQFLRAREYTPPSPPSPPPPPEGTRHPAPPPPPLSLPPWRWAAFAPPTDLVRQLSAGHAPPSCVWVCIPFLSLDLLPSGQQKLSSSMGSTQTAKYCSSFQQPLDFFSGEIIIFSLDCKRLAFQVKDGVSTPFTKQLFYNRLQIQYQDRNNGEDFMRIDAPIIKPRQDIIKTYPRRENISDTL